MRPALTGVAMHPGLTPISLARRFWRAAVLSRTTVRPLHFGFPRFLPFFKSLPSRRLRVFALERDGWPKTANRSFWRRFGRLKTD